MKLSFDELAGAVFTFTATVLHTLLNTNFAQVVEIEITDFLPVAIGVGKMVCVWVGSGLFGALGGRLGRKLWGSGNGEKNENNGAS